MLPLNVEVRPGLALLVPERFLLFLFPRPPRPLEPLPLPPRDAPSWDERLRPEVSVPVVTVEPMTELLMVSSDLAEVVGRPPRFYSVVCSKKDLLGPHLGYRP